MTLIRRIAALLIALSLVLPQRSCVNNGQVQIDYPLSNAQDWQSYVVIGAFFLLPLLLLFVRRFRVAGLIAGVLVTAAGLYYISYAATILATKMLVGWYAYTLGAVAYLGATLMELVRAVRTRHPPPGG
jgi:hypothetical protein